MAVAEVGLAVNDRRKDQSGQWIEETTFVDVTLWGRTAEIAGEYLGKGSPVLIEGRLKLDTWEKDGQKRYEDARRRRKDADDSHRQVLKAVAVVVVAAATAVAAAAVTMAPALMSPNMAVASRCRPLPPRGGGRSSQPSPPPNDDIPF
jgi:single-stranded DNA-binding protein